MKENKIRDIDLFRNEINKLRNDWFNEYKPLLGIIKSPKDVEEDARLDLLCGTTDMDSFGDICAEAIMVGMKRMPKYTEVINSLYCQFIQKVAAEVDRITLMVLSKHKYPYKRFDFKKFEKFSMQLSKDNDIERLKNFRTYDLLHKVNNFLKHNSKDAYETLKNNYHENVRNIEDKTSDSEYENGMYAGSWIILEENYIDGLFDQLIEFFEDYSNTFLR